MKIKLSAVAVAALVAACSPQSSSNQTTANQTAPSGNAAADAAAAATAAAADASKAAAAAAAAPEQTGWTYDSQTDEMRGTTAYFARLRSENELSLGFPYDARRVSLTLRKRSKDGQSIMLDAPGQFLCHVDDDDTVAVKFDNGPIQHFPCGEAADGTTGVLFIYSEGRFISKLKAAKRVIIEAQMYQAGPQQMTFDVSGLKWPPQAEKPLVKPAA